MRGLPMALMMAAMLGGGISAKERRSLSPVQPDRNRYRRNPKPQLRVKDIPKGCKKETIEVTVETTEHSFIVPAEIVYGTIQGRTKKVAKITHEIRGWIYSTELAYIKTDPSIRITVNELPEVNPLFL